MFTRFRTRLEGREEGFTLIELLVVIIIIGILAAIAIPVFLNQRSKAYQKSVDSDVRNATVALEAFYSDAQSYNPVAGGTAAQRTALDDNLVVSSGNQLTVYGDGTSFCIKAVNIADNTIAAYDSSLTNAVVEGAAAGAPCALATFITKP